MTRPRADTRIEPALPAWLRPDEADAPRRENPWLTARAEDVLGSLAELPPPPWVAPHVRTLQAAAAVELVVARHPAHVRAELEANEEEAEGR